MIILGLLAGDLAWWWRMHRLLRGEAFSGSAVDKRAVLWRGILGGFIGLMGGGLLLLMGMRFSGWLPESAFPSWLFALVYVWHLVVLPMVLVSWGAVSFFGFGSGVLKEWLSRWFPGSRFNVFEGREPSCSGVPERLDGGSRERAVLSESTQDCDRSTEEERLMAAVNAQGRVEESVGFGFASRRDFFKAALGSSPALVALGATGSGLISLDHFRVQRLEVPIPDLPEALDGMSIAHVSDLHVGRFTRGAILERIVEVTNGLEADLVAFTGDLVNYSLEDLPAGLDLMKGFRAKHGVFAVEGNHDLIVDGGQFRRRTGAVVPLLVNEKATVQVRGCDVDLLGLGWGSDPIPLVGEIGGGGSGAFRILLAHHPHVFDAAGDIPLTLSGHTHGGQLMLNERLGVGPVMFRYWSGLYRKQNRSLVVSNGVGNWFPLRTNAPAEVTHLVLRRDLSSKG